MREPNRAPLAAGAPSEASDYDGWTPSTYTDWQPDQFIEFIKELTKWQLQTEEKTTTVINFVTKYKDSICAVTREGGELFTETLAKFCDSLKTTANALPKDATLIAWPVLATALNKKLLDHLTAINELQDHLTTRRLSNYDDQLDSQPKLSILIDELSTKINEIIDSTGFPTADEEKFLMMRDQCKSSEQDWRPKEKEIDDVMRTL